MNSSTEELIADLRKNAGWLEEQIKNLPKTIKLERQAATKLHQMYHHLSAMLSILDEEFGTVIVDPGVQALYHHVMKALEEV